MKPRIAVVTGAGSGICQAVALRLASDGLSVALLDVNEAGLEQTRSMIVAAQGNALSITTDVSDVESVTNAMAIVERDLGLPSVLVNGAGIVIRKSILETTPAELQRVLQINLVGFFSMLQATIPLMKRAGGGSIVQIASSAAHRGGHSYAAYAAAKGGVVALTRHLATDLAPDNIRINSVSPGPIYTGLNRASLSEEANRTAMEYAIPMGRIGEAEEVASVIAFLAGESSNYVTGIDVPVDGGFISKVTLGPDNNLATFDEKP